jgi:hypothetical protein
VLLAPAVQWTAALDACCAARGAALQQRRARLVRLEIALYL